VSVHVARDLNDALDHISSATEVTVLAGGTDLVGLMKDGLARPQSLVDLTGIEGLRGWSHAKGRGLRIGALTPLVELETSDALAKTMPILRESLRDAATVQLRTMGTVGGNLLQRNRCWYFRDEGTVCWLKGGNRCFAIDGENRYHAIIGARDCVIVSPSDLVPAHCNAHVYLRAALRPPRSISVKAAVSPWMTYRIFRTIR